MTDEILNQMFIAANDVGLAEWGATDELSVTGHLEHIRESINITAETFDQTGKQAMHGVYVDGENTVLCHTGTSPNSPTHARILAALWNRFVSEARGLDSGDLITRTEANAMVQAEREAMQCEIARLREALVAVRSVAVAGEPTSSALAVIRAALMEASA